MSEAAIANGASRRKAKQNSGRTTYCTPPVVLNPMGALGRLACDPCWHETSLVRARITFTKETNGLAHNWPSAKYGLTFSNPPYGDELTNLWAPKFVEQARLGVELLTLVPASTETEAYRMQLFACSGAMHIKFRLTFVGEEHPAFFSSALFYFGHRPSSFIEAFRPIAYPIDSPLRRAVWRAAA